MSNIQGLLGQRIRKLRDDADLSRFALAEKFEVDPSTVQSWENGTRWPGPEYLEKYCETFGVKPWALFAAQDEVPVPSPRDAVQVLEAFVEQMLAPRPQSIREASQWKAAETELRIPPAELELLEQIAPDNHEAWEIIRTTAVTIGKAKPRVKPRT